MIVWHCRQRLRFNVASLVAIAALCFLGTDSDGASGAGGQRYVVVVSPDVTVSDISLVELQRIFLFEKRFWKSGSPISIIFSATDLDPGSFVLSEVYRLEYPSLKRLMLEKFYQVEMDLPPRVVGNDRTSVEFVAAGKGLITIVAIEELSDQEVTVLTVNGESPDSPQYPLCK